MLTTRETVGNAARVTRIENVICTSDTFPFNGPLAPSTARRAARVAIGASTRETRIYGCETARETFDRLRCDPAMGEVFATVIRTGKSAHDLHPDERVSDVVLIVALLRDDRNPVALQRDVTRYADAMDAL